ncbi:MAG: methyltransferase domain-containing protein [Candidatus Hodarchaeota archaeon]
MIELSEAEEQVLLVISYTEKTGNQTSRQDLRKIGEENIGKFLLDWEQAYANLIRKGLIRKTENRIFLTPEGERHRDFLLRKKNLVAYEYDNFFSSATASKAHQKFCKEVYGLDLCQNGITDLSQLHKLLEVLDLSDANTVLELGCGNGLIAKYIWDKTGATITGIDISKTAIEQAKKLSSKSQYLNFQIGNMYHLEFSENSVDTIISIDTLYFVDDKLDQVIPQLLKILKPNGQMGVFFTQWIDGEHEKELLEPRSTELAMVLNKNNLNYKTWNFTNEETKHWQKKIQVLEKLKPEFLEEDNQRFTISGDHHEHTQS